MRDLFTGPVCLMTILLTQCSIFSHGLACENAVFGPKQYVRTTGSPNIYSDSFAAFTQKGDLVIENGNVNGKHRVTSACVFVNNQKVLDPHDFKKSHYRMRVPVDLSDGQNTLRVELRSKPGTYLTIRIVQQAPPPEVFLHAVPDTVNPGGASILSWTSRNAVRCILEPDLGPVDLSGSIAVHPVGTTTYTIRAEGPGGIAKADATVAVLNSPPVALDDMLSQVMAPSVIIPFSSLLANDTDADGDDLSIISFTQPTVGSLADNGDQTFTYVLQAGCGMEDQFLYTVGDGRGGCASAQVTLRFTVPSSITVLKPDGIEDVTDCSFTITWTDEAPAGNAAVSLYYDTDDGGMDGVLIVSGLTEDPDGAADQYVWNTDPVPEGEYYIYAVMEDGVNPTVSDYSAGKVTIRRPLAPETKLLASDASPASYFGKAVAVSGDVAVVGAPGHEIGEATPGCAYIYKRVCLEFVEEAILTAGEDGNYGDEFGDSVAVSGDFAIIGAYGDDDRGNQAGAAYIFKRDAEGWVRQAKLTADDGQAYDYFGSSVAISGDIAVIGAPGKDAPGYDAGVAYIFQRQGDVWTLRARYTSDTGRNLEYFGYAVAVDGNTAVIGAYGDGDRGYAAGAVYVVERQGDAWSLAAKLTVGETDDRLGVSVAVSGGYIVAGAFRENGDKPGRAYIFRKDESTWGRQATVFAENPDEAANFGISVAIDGDHVLVGAYETETWDPGFTGYLYGLEDGAWVYRFMLTSQVAEGADFHGYSVGISGKLALIGAYGDQQGGENAGAAYVYAFENHMRTPSISLTAPDGLHDIADCSYTIQWADLDLDDNASISLYYDTDDNGVDGTLIVSGLGEDPDGAANEYVWDTTSLPPGYYHIYAVIDDGSSTPVVSYAKGPVHIHTLFGFQKLTDSDGGPDQLFGRSVSVSGGTVLVGMQYEGDDATVLGRVSIWERGNGVFRDKGGIVAPSGNSYDGFGRRVAISGDYAVVGADNDDEQGYAAGAAYILQRQGDVWGVQTKLTAPDGGELINFGQAVALDGDIAVVGANGNDAGIEGCGAAYVYQCDGDDWIFQAKLTASDKASNSLFGLAVAVDGNTIVVGAYNAYGDLANAGAAYVFQRIGNDWVEQAKLTAGEYRQSYGEFGISVDVEESHLLVGATGDHEAAWNGGAAYFFHRDDSGWTLQTKLTGPEGFHDCYFGKSVALNGEYAVVGQAGYENNGAAHVFKRTGDVWTEYIDLFAGDDSNGDSHGSAVSMDGGVVIVGAFGDNALGDRAGAARIYTLKRGSISAHPDVKTASETATLSWQFPGADSVSIDNGIGEVPLEGSLSVAPVETTAYTITARGCWGTDTDTVTVKVPPVVNLTGDLTAINLGEATLLTWSATLADTCVIEPGIGTVPVSGSLSVSPSVTTTYFITATGPGGSTTTGLTIEVIQPLPTVSISADPASIDVGGSATLTWSAEHADTCIITPGIGSVDVSGFLTVMPDVTTTYVITATGLGGVTTAETALAVIYPAPVVDISAMPHVINAGESAILTWNVANATSCVIDNGIGSVDLSGSLAVSPASTTTYTLTATGIGGVTTAGQVVTITPIVLSITSPLNGDAVFGPDVMVTGAIANPTGNETGVVVNGVVGLVRNGTFVANHVPLVEGENTIVAFAADSGGNYYSSSRTVYADLESDYIRIASYPVSGSGPLTATLKISGSFDLSSATVLQDGPVPVAITSGAVDTYHAEMSEPGIYYFSVETDHQGIIYSDTVAVEVLDTVALNALLQAKWGAMKSALSSGNVEAAVSLFTDNTKDRYREIFTALSDHLSEITTGMQEIEMITTRNNNTKYRIVKQQEIEGVTRDITYYVYFIKDATGLWHIEKF